MPVIQTSLFILVERFPDHRYTIKRLYMENENFQTTCEDYRRCTEALLHWNQSASEEAPARREEYAALLKDLEAEILQALNESK